MCERMCSDFSIGCVIKGWHQSKPIGELFDFTVGKSRWITSHQGRKPKLRAHYSARLRKRQQPLLCYFYVHMYILYSEHPH